jgi:tryptophan synthase alpha chain
MTHLRSVLEGIRTSGRAALIPYLTAGDPSLAATVDLAEALVEGGADILELGVPFSDPLADGPVIQRAAERALAAGTRPADVLECARRIRDRTGVPIVVMSYLNPLLRYGWSAFTRDAAAAGVAGTILTDVPVEEAEPFLADAANAGIGTVFLVAPTSSGERIRAAAAVTTGFLYCVSRLGVTGARTDLSDAYRPVVEQVRAVTDLPVGVGFGISTAEHARAAGAVADGVIIGSRLVAEVESAASVTDAAAALRRLTRSFRDALEERGRGDG